MLVDFRKNTYMFSKKDVHVFGKTRTSFFKGFIEYDST